MKKYLVSLILLAPGWLSAQVLISDFATIGTQAYLPFNDTWGVPVNQFTQSAGFISITAQGGGDPNGEGGFDANIAGSLDGSNPVDLTGYTHLSLTARVDAGNASSSTVVLIRDTAFEIIGTAQFMTSNFSTSGFNTVSAILDLQGYQGSISDAAYWTIAGDGFTGSYRMSLDNLSAIAIPEPSIGGLLAIGLMGLVLKRRAGGSAIGRI